MHNSTKQYLKRQIIKLINETNDTEHKGGSVTVWDIEKIANEMKYENGKLGYHDVDDLYSE